MGLERLDKIIASQGIFSRRDVHRLVRDGAITVNGITATDSACQADAQKDKITASGRELTLRKYVYIMMNKPKGVLSAASDKKADTVVDLVPQELRRKNLFPAGRLDKDTTGFILITDDGDFAHRILSPKNHIVKTYEALLSHEISQTDIEAFRDGILLEDGTQCQPAELIPLGGTNVRIKICEGKFHQIKRMAAACGNEVLELKRTAMGGLELDDTLSPGGCRELTQEEVQRIIGA